VAAYLSLPWLQVEPEDYLARDETLELILRPTGGLRVDWLRPSEFMRWLW
jgi:hypothetical protein